MKKIIFGIILLITISWNGKQRSKFILDGKTKGIINGTCLYLQSSLNENILDSSFVTNNKFKFKTALPNSPLLAVIRNKDYSNYRFLWLENSLMTFDGTKTDFKRAIVKGSKTEELSQSLYLQIDSLPRNEQLMLEMKFVNDNPNSIVSANILSVYSTTWGKEKVSELFKKFSIENKNSLYGQKIARFIQLNRNIEKGMPFIDFAMADQNGNLVRLSDLKGKTVLLEFWASSCSPCRQENPNLVRTYAKYKPKGFEVFAVSLDNRKDMWLNAIRKDSLNWKNVSDLKGNDNEASLIYGITGIPDNFLIDQNGVIIGRNLRGLELMNKLEEIMPSH